MSRTADIWVFGYGSLMWDPGFPYEDRVPALVRGWHRDFSILSVESWGEAGRPGLVAALHPGGACHGVAFRIAGRAWPEVERYLAQRERAYRRVSARAALDGRLSAVLTHVYDPAHPRGALGLAPAEKARLIATAGTGAKGSGRFYLEQTVAELARCGRRAEPATRQLLTAVTALCSAAPAAGSARPIDGPGRYIR